MHTATYSLAVFALTAAPVLMGQNGSTTVKPPQTPSNLNVPSGNVAYLKAHAVGTQNYICVPGANGPNWKFLGPQATLFLTFTWLGAEVRVQAATHYLSPNPAEAGLGRPTWQHSIDSSTIWGKAIAQSSDPQYVAPNAIPWLLVEIVGAQRGPTGGSALSSTTYIQRVATSGGIAPTAGCDASAYGTVGFSSYETDYYFYQAAGHK